MLFLPQKFNISLIIFLISSLVLFLFSNIVINSLFSNIPNILSKKVLFLIIIKTIFFINSKKSLSFKIYMTLSIFLLLVNFKRFRASG